MEQTGKYIVSDLSLEKIRNRQELRVIERMRPLLEQDPNFCGCRLCVEDVYALALNALPAQYVQSGSMVLRSQGPSEQDVARAVEDGIDKVRVRPNHNP
jgi:hypothetical protein